MIGPSEPKSSTPISKRLTRRHFIESAIGAVVGAGVGAPARATTTNEIVMMTATDLSAAIRNKKVSGDWTFAANGALLLRPEAS